MTASSVGLLLFGLVEATSASAAEASGPTRALGLSKPGPVVPLEEGFRNPPPISRVQCWWQPPGSPFTREEITRELEEFKAHGMGGVTIKDTTEMPRDERTQHIKDIPFMSDAWLDMFAHIVAECGRLGLICRSRSSSGWNEGGPWIPLDQSSKALVFAKSEVLTGPKKLERAIPRDETGSPDAALMKTGDVIVLAIKTPGPEVIELADKVSADGMLRWDMPEGSWTLLSCFGKPTGKRLMSTSKTGAGLHHDHLSKAATDLHLREFAGRMLKRLGQFEGTAFDGFNSDGFEFGKATWTPGLRRIFLERCGYDAAPWLPALDGFDLGEKGQRFRYDFQTTISDLIVENFYQRSSAWCRDHGVSFEAQGVGGPSHALPMDFMRACGAVDIPMGETWIHGRTYAKIASSAAHAYGRRLVGLEFSTQKDWFFAPTPGLLKLRADESFLLGANYLCLPCVDYTPPEAGSPGWVHSQPCRLGLRQTWWPFSRPLFDYLARCSFLLQSGTNVADVAVCNSFLSRDRMLWLAPDDDSLSTHSRDFAFDYVNDDLLGQMRVEGGRLVVNSGAAYQVLCISPPTLGSGDLGQRPKTVTEERVALPLETLVKIRELLAAGATVVWAGEPCSNSPSLKNYPASDAKYAATMKELWQNPRLLKVGREYHKQLAAVLNQGAAPPAWRLPEKSPLRIVHRRTAEAEIFFVVNRGVLDEHRTFTELLASRKRDTGEVQDLFEEGPTVNAPVFFRVQSRTPELWLPETGEIKPAAAEPAPGGTLVNLTLPPQGSVFVVFRGDSGPGGKLSPKPRDDDRPTQKVQPVEGDWEISFPPGWKTPAAVRLNELKSWTEHTDFNVRHFNGIATYRKTLDIRTAPTGNESMILDLGRVAAVCEASLNGQPLGVAWRPPYRFDITRQARAGENELVLRVANPWHNRLVADANLKKNERVSRMYPESRYARYRGRQLIPSGLLGPVRILTEAREHP